MTQKQLSLRDKIKKLGYASNNQVRLYGIIFQLISDSIPVTDNLVVVDAIEQKSGRVKRICIPLPVIQMAKRDHRAA